MKPFSLACITQVNVGPSLRMLLLLVPR